MKTLSVVIPAYNEEANVENTANVLSQLLEKNGINYELVFVDDGSKDKTWDKLSALTHTHKGITAIKFSKNFGKEGAIFAGLKTAKGDACVVMDCDLQHPPETLIEMYNIWLNNDVDIVEARKSSRGKESLLYKIFAKSFYKLFQSSSGIDLKRASDFKLMDRKAVAALNEMPERLTFFRALSSWVGFKTEIIYFDVAPRNSGQSKWSFKKLFRFAIDSITSFTTLPMHIVTFFGALFSVFAVIMAINTLFNFFSGKALEGFSTVILLVLITGGIIMLSLGIIGYYLSKIYEEIKFRPRYIISQKLESKEDQN